MAERKYIQAEKVEGRALAVIYDGGDLGKELLEQLRHEGLRVIFVNSEMGLPALEKPSYVIFFATDKSASEQLKSDWKEAIVTAKRNGARLVLCLDNLASGIVQRLADEALDSGQPVNLVEIVGVFEGKDDLTTAARKIVREVFSPSGEDRVMLVGKRVAKTEPRHYTTNVTDRKPREREMGIRTGPVQYSRWLKVVSLMVILFCLPLLLATALAGWGVIELRSGGKLITSGQFDQARLQSKSAGQKLTLAGDIIARWEFVSGKVGLGQVTRNYSDLLMLGKAAASGVAHGATAAKLSSQLITGILDTNGSGTDLGQDIAVLKSELLAIELELSLIEAQWPGVAGTVTSLASWAGGSADKLANLTENISTGRKLLTRASSFLDVLPEVVGKAGETKRKYLVVLQNSSELRPTGGFIGSYAIVSFDNGKLLDFKVNDIYSADGQLKGRIQPPDEILHFLGQPSWYMRDANWAADWELSAKRLEWFLEKETGEKVDGVWAVSLPAVQKFLVATGELVLPELSQTVSATDFYRKAEYSAEINFFPGSTQKRDFLGATAQALLEKLSSSKGKDWGAIALALGQALSAKDILIYFNNDVAQKAVEAASWSGGITTNGCLAVRANCLMVVDANLGANKANFFLNRSITVNTLIGKAGEVENRLVLRYQNNSPSLGWPGGIYKDYLRFLLPVDSQLVGVDLDDGRKPRVSQVLTADVLSAVPPDQFLVFKNMELSGKSRGASDSALLSFGTYFEVGVGQSRTVSFSYRPGYRVNFLDKTPRLDFLFLRQPGSGDDPLEIIVDYPNFLQPSLENTPSAGGKTLVFPQKLDYTTDLSVDRRVSVKFQQTN